jgi:hypothetical protein
VDSSASKPALFAEKKNVKDAHPREFNVMRVMKGLGRIEKLPVYLVFRFTTLYRHCPFWPDSKKVAL